MRDHLVCVCVSERADVGVLSSQSGEKRQGVQADSFPHCSTHFSQYCRSQTDWPTQWKTLQSSSRWGWKILEYRIGVYFLDTSFSHVSLTTSLSRHGCVSGVGRLEKCLWLVMVWRPLGVVNGIALFSSTRMWMRLRMSSRIKVCIIVIQSCIHFGVLGTCHFHPLPFLNHHSD